MSYTNYLKTCKCGVTYTTFLKDFKCLICNDKYCHPEYEYKVPRKNLPLTHVDSQILMKHKTVHLDSQDLSHEKHIFCSKCKKLWNENTETHCDKCCLT